MAYQVIVSKEAKRILKKYDHQLACRIVEAMEALEHNPRPHGVEKMSGYRDRWRVRVGDYRIVYQIEDDVLVVLVITIGHRGHVYRGL